MATKSVSMAIESTAAVARLTDSCTTRHVHDLQTLILLVLTQFLIATDNDLLSCHQWQQPTFLSPLAMAYFPVTNGNIFFVATGNALLSGHHWQSIHYSNESMGNVNQTTITPTGRKQHCDLCSLPK